MVTGQYYFQYAITGRAKCYDCKQMIPLGAFRVKRQISSKEAWFHFDCLWKHKIGPHCSKYDVMIQMRDPPKSIWFWVNVYDEPEEEDDRIVKHCGSRYACLFTIETDGEGLTSMISQADFDRICHNFALAAERKTPHYIPKVVRGSTWHTCYYYNYGGCEYQPGVTYFLQYRGRDCHPGCLAASGKTNMDAKDFEDYNILSDDEKRDLDQLFKQDDAAFFFPKVVVNNFSEYCELSQCGSNYPMEFPGEFFHKNNLIGANDLRIRYGSKCFHPMCFGRFHKAKFDAKDVVGYEALDAKNKAVIDKYIKKPADYDIPVVSRREFEEYCCAEECLESETLSKFPYPYTIIPYTHIPIKFQNKLYHPKCLQATGKVNIDAKDIQNYDTLDNDEKESLDQIFKKAEKRKLDENQSDEDPEAAKENDEPSAKKFKDDNGNEQEQEV
uniref:PARP-type domain-containing protein n=1 Tax=Panagrolaimus sp. ES5 TaxID=591445 RepID=A0AC34F9D7_9BILA